MEKKPRSEKLQSQRREASKRYHEKIERVVFYVPDGHKATIQGAADKVDESINGYVNNAVLARMGLTDWPKKENDREGN